MKTKLLTLFSLLALLLVSTVVLADGRPTGIRIGRAVSGGGTNVEIDVTITATWTRYYYGSSVFNSSTVWIGNALGQGNSPWATQLASAWTSTNSPPPFPWAVDWGDGYYVGDAVLFKDNGPWRGTFAHTYLAPGTYLVTAADAIGCCSISALTGGNSHIYTGNAITGLTRYVWASAGGTFTAFSWSSVSPRAYILTITNTATVTTGTGIPALNIYGLLAMAFVLVGSGVLLFRKPQQA